jgi:hypothetical protein
MYYRFETDDHDLSVSLLIGLRGEYPFHGTDGRFLREMTGNLQMNFFWESEEFWPKSVLALWKRFSESGSRDCTDALQQMENPWNEINNGPLNYFSQHSDLEMLISSLGTPENWDKSHFTERILKETPHRPG